MVVRRELPGKPRCGESRTSGLGRGAWKHADGNIGRCATHLRHHLSLREALPKPIPTKGNGSPKKWMLRTPAMAAGLTDHVWTMGEFLLFRVPPWRQEATAA
jgi:hypothetical protein